MELFLWIMGATFLGSVVSLIGRSLVFVTKRNIKKYTYYFISFAVGTMLAVVFLDLLPEAAEYISFEDASKYALVGFILFFIFEKALFWHHCHDGECDVHASGYLILWGDAIHNFIDGVIIALAFMADVRLGVITAIAVVFHEIPQEMSDFFILLNSGFERSKALVYNFLISLVSLLGAALTFFLASGADALIGPALGLVAGHFLYISASDLVPELHLKVPTKKQIFLQIFFILLGVTLIYTVGVVLPA